MTYARPTYLYRLEIVFPSDSKRVDWAPTGWWERNVESFRWPRRRDYLSLVGVEDRANLFRSYGAEVTVVRSDRVTWPQGEQAKSAREESKTKRLLNLLLVMREELQ